MKICKKCGLAKPLDQFCKSTHTKSGRTQPCMTCKNTQNQKWKDDNRQQYLQIIKNNRNSEWGHQRRTEWYIAHRDNEKTKAQRKQRHKRWRQRHPDKMAEAYRRTAAKDPNKAKAREAVRQAIEHGLLPKVQTLACVHCNNQAQHYHHYKGYAKENWLDVKPVCNSCHGVEHRVL